MVARLRTGADSLDRQCGRRDVGRPEVLASGLRRGASCSRGRQSGDRTNVRAAVAAARDHQPIPLGLRPSLVGLGEQKADSRCLRLRERHPSAVQARRPDERSQRSWCSATRTRGTGSRRSTAQPGSTGYAAYFLVKPACNASTCGGPMSRPSGSAMHFRDWAARQIRRLHPARARDRRPGSRQRARPEAAASSGMPRRLIRMYERWTGPAGSDSLRRRRRRGRGRGGRAGPWR